MTTDDRLDDVVLALLFAADEPLTVRRICSVVEGLTPGEATAVVERWRRRFDEDGWCIAVDRVAGGYQLVTRPEFAPFIARLYSGRRRVRLSKAALETLAIIAYKQPITRAEIEQIRGVGCGGVLGNLMERSLIRITGKAKVLGAPFLYGTTSEFLEYLGLDSLADLPSLEELEAMLEREEAAGRPDAPAQDAVGAPEGAAPADAAAPGDGGDAAPPGEPPDDGGQDDARPDEPAGA